VFHSYIFRCAEHMWVHQKKWETLVTRELGVSGDMVRLLNCLTSLLCRRLREKTLAAVDACSKLILAYEVCALKLIQLRHGRYYLKSKHSSYKHEIAAF